MEDQSTQRRLVAVLIADIAGYTRLMERDTDGTVAAWQTARQEVIKPVIADHSGKIVKLTGDGFLVEFSTIQNAVNCAIVMQRGLAPSSLDFRIGINLGDIVDDGEDIHGEGVNIAARLEGLADPGGICISGDVYNQVRNRLDCSFEDMGEHHVKHVSAPIRVFRVLTESMVSNDPANAKIAPKSTWLPAIAVILALLVVGVSVTLWQRSWNPAEDPASPEASAYPLPDKPSIAVLPFTNLSDDPNQEYFVDGMTEDLITDLAKIQSLFVIARNTVFTYKGKSVVVPDVARELGIRYVLEGSVRRVGDAVRINAQLIDGASGAHIWAERYDGTLADIFALQDRVTSEIVAQLQITLTPDEQNRRNRRGTDNPNAHDAYLRGWQFYRRYTPEDFARAIPHFEQAIKLDPNYGLASAALASIYWIAYRRSYSWSRFVNPNWNNMISVQGARNKAERHLRQAMRSPTPLAHQIESQFSWEYRQFERALKEAKQAVALDQNDPAGHLAMAWALIFAGRAEAAIASTETGIRLDPNFPGSHLFALGTAQLMLERYDAAKTTLKRALAFNPENLEIMAPLAIAFARTGKQDEAKAALQKYIDVWILWGQKIETYMTWWPFKREADVRLFGGGLIKAGLCCKEPFEAYIGRLRRGGTLE
jgi:TolB-like protein/class 3 adenylate cyclase